MAKFIGTSGDDNLLGEDSDDVLKGLDGDDFIFGNYGADRLIGGKGNDGLDGADGDSAADTMLGGGGDDRINGDSGDRLNGGVGVDWFGLYLQTTNTPFKLDLTGLTKGGSLHMKDGTVVTGMEAGEIRLGLGDDKVTVGDAHVAVYGGIGADTLIGGDGSDTLGAGSGNDLINGGNGSDWVSYDSIFFGPVHVDLRIQGEAQDTVWGNTDTLISIENVQGGFGDDTLIGDNRANKLDSYAGADSLTGGGGADTFVFTYAGQSEAFSPVTITDLSNDDVIDLHEVDADSTTDGNQDFNLVAHFNGHAGQLIVFKSGDNTLIQTDTNGDGFADDAILVLGNHADFDNFVL